jgi:uncharacterized membrane protein
MKTIDIRKEAILWVVLIVPFIYLAFIWSRIPEQIPTHWGIDGKPNDYSNKYFGSLLIPCMNIALYFFLLFIPRIDPRAKNYDLFKGAYFAIRMAIIGFLCLTYFLTMEASLNKNIDPVKWIPAGVCLLIAIMGNVMTKVRPNYFVGIRTPWTIESPVVWQKTHRLAGKIWVLGGIAGFLFSIFVRGYFLPGFLIGLIAVIALVPAVYSYIIFQKLKKEGMLGEN